MFGPAVNNPAKITIPHSGLFTNIGWKTVHTFNRLEILPLEYNNDIFAYLSDSSQQNIQKVQWAPFEGKYRLVQKVLVNNTTISKKCVPRILQQIDEIIRDFTSLHLARCGRLRLTVSFRSFNCYGSLPNAVLIGLSIFLSIQDTDYFVTFL